MRFANILRKTAAIALFAVGFSHAGAAERPNVIVFIGDDIGWNDYGCYGSPDARTPSIDALAAGGLRFTQAFLTASSCSPSRASLITGRYPHNNTTACELHAPIPAHLPWLPEVLRQSGYYTALVGKNHMRRDAKTPPEREPWDLVDNGQLPGNSGADGKWPQVVRDRPQDKPFFFWFAAIDAHRDWDADRQWDAGKYGPKHKPEDRRVPPFLADDAPTRQDLASYANEVTRFDYFIGQTVEVLREQGALDNTLIFVLADNGRPFPRAKTRLHDSGMKTALVAHWPKGIAKAGADAGGLVSAIDLAPTILAAAGAEAPETMQGASLLAVFADPAAEIRKAAFSEHNWHDYEAHGRSVRADGFLYIRNSRPALAWQGPADSVRSPSHQSLLKLRDGGGSLTPGQADVLLAPRPAEELYDCAADPDQLNNLAADPAFAGRKAALAKLLDRWIDETGDSAPAQLTPDRFDREKGTPLGGKIPAGTSPGSDRGADKINAPGPR